MKTPCILLAPDSYKGCLSSFEVCGAMRAGVKKALCECEVMAIPSSDGGEGFVDCVRAANGGETVAVEVTSPTGERITAEYLLNGSEAFIELASASGLTLVPEDRRNPATTTTLGTGELIADAISRGAKKITVGLGGSATNDCGMGIMCALGARFFDCGGRVLYPCGASLCRVNSFDLSGMPDLSGVKFVAACDVENPLTGANGAAMVFALQKGADEAMAKELDDGLNSFASVIGFDCAAKGGGAAGGAGAILLHFMKAEYISGASVLISGGKFNAALDKADLVITGEGKTDFQTGGGKLVSAVAKAAAERGVPVAVVSGSVEDGFETLYQMGVTAGFSICDKPMTLENAISDAPRLIAKACESVVRLVFRK